jgi:hypothetical protein
MLSHLVGSLRDVIKSETELYTMRVNQQVNRYCSMLETASSFECNGISGQAIANMQQQIDVLKENMDAIMGELFTKGIAKSECSSIQADVFSDDRDNVVVNKIHPEEIKEVHINFDNESVISSGKSSDVQASPKEIDLVIPNEIAVGGSVNEVAVPESGCAGSANEEVAEEVVEEETDDIEKQEEDVEDEQEEEEEEEQEEGLEVEEFEYKGVKYYKDLDDNVYEYLEDGECGEAIGTMSKKVPGKVLLYTS